MSGGEDKTENATPKRMRELRRDGSLQRSHDVSAWLGMGVAGVTLSIVRDQDHVRARAAHSYIPGRSPIYPCRERCGRDWQRASVARRPQS